MALRRCPPVVVVAVILGVCCPAALRADESEKAGEGTPPQPVTRDAQAEPLEGFWPTERMIENFIGRAVVQIADQYDLSDEQAQYLKEMSLERWPAFLKEHRRQLQPLVNRYFEQRMAVEPPDAEDVKVWAGGALEMLEVFREEMHEQQMAFRRILEPSQKLKFDAEQIKFNLGMQAFATRLEAWQEGRYQQREVWEALRRRGDRRRSDLADGPAAASQPADVADALIPIDQWARYVERFAQRHELDEAQLATARSILDDLYGRATAYTTRHQQEYDALNQRPPEQRDQEWHRARQDLDQPVVELFNELVVRLDGLLTSAQRQRDVKASGQPEPAGSGT